MGARLFRGVRPAALVLLTVGTLLSTPVGASAPRATPQPVATLVGGSILAKAACLGCAVGLFGLGGATIGGVVILATLYPEAFGACAVVCLEAL